MARWTHNIVSLSADQAAGTAPVLAAQTASPGCGERRLIAIANRSASAIELFFDVAAATGGGVPLAAGVVQHFSGALPPFDGALYVLGATAADKIVIITG